MPSRRRINGVANWLAATAKTSAAVLIAGVLWSAAATAKTLFSCEDICTGEIASVKSKSLNRNGKRCGTTQFDFIII